MSGTVLLIAGPSGSGKTTLTRALVNRVPFLTRAITVTTRLPRPGEVSGEDYHFVSPERFVEMNQSGALIECAETYTESYGIPRTVLVGLVRSSSHPHGWWRPCSSAAAFELHQHLYPASFGSSRGGADS